jgi:hypothetical protein
MGYSLQIRHKGKFVIPKDSGYVPPNPQWPYYIKLGGQHMATLIQFMVAAGVVDKRIRSGKDRAKCKAGMVPVYKFCSNDGFVVTAKEAGMIAESLESQDVLSPAFLKEHFPKVKPKDTFMMKLFTKLMALWIPYNRVAATNNGYTIK